MEGTETDMKTKLKKTDKDLQASQLLISQVIKIARNQPKWETMERNITN